MPRRTGVVRRRQHRAFVAVDGVHAEEVLDLAGDLCWRMLAVPLVQQLAEHGVRPALRALDGARNDRQPHQGNLAEASVLAKLVVCHAHVLLVRLRVRRRDGLQLRRWRRLEDTAATVEQQPGICSTHPCSASNLSVWAA